MTTRLLYDVSGVVTFSHSGTLTINSDSSAVIHQIYGGTGASGSILIDGTSNATRSSSVLCLLPGGGKAVVIGATSSTWANSSSTGLDVWSGGRSLILGADNNASTRTDATTKSVRIVGVHYTNAEEPVEILLAAMSTSASILTFGGGTSAANCATNINFTTAADTTTVTGTTRMTIGPSGIVTANNSFIANENGDADGDVRFESDTETNMLFLDANGNTDGQLFLGGSTNGHVIEKGGDTYWIGTGAGLPYGFMYGLEINQSQVAAQNTWYIVNDTDITDGPTNLVTGDGAGKLTVTKAGTYLINWTMTLEANTNNKHLVGGFAINGTAQTLGQSHIESITNQELTLAGTAISALTASQYVQLAFRTTDTGTPTINIDDVNLTVVMVGS